MKKLVDFMKKKTIDVFNDASVKVPFIIPEITKNDKSVISNALNSRLLTDGPKLHKFESVFAKFTGAKFARSEERRVGKECRSRWSPYH